MNRLDSRSRCTKCKVRVPKNRPKICCWLCGQKHYSCQGLSKLVRPKLTKSLPRLPLIGYARNALLKFFQLMHAPKILNIATVLNLKLNVTVAIGCHIAKITSRCVTGVNNFVTKNVLTGNWGANLVVKI